MHGGADIPAVTSALGSAFTSAAPSAAISAPIPRPFPFPFNVGTDVVSLQRIRAVIEKKRPARDGKAQSNLIPFLRHVFTPREQLEFWARFKKEHLALGTNITRVTEYIGGRSANCNH